ncbi:MAG: carboxylating nicotinate-nucleotide diphosphorylase [Microthrixaceae bacterium]
MSAPDPTDEAVGPDPEWLHPPMVAVREAVSRALAEDLLPLGDLTGTLLGTQRIQARLVSRAAGSIAGSRCVTETYAQAAPDAELTWEVPEGAAVQSGETLATVHGPLRSLVTAERTALNFLGHLSGIATLTAAYVKAASVGGDARIWDTRKTTPGLRSLEKAAVRAGGGRNHRGNLSDWLLIKDNHLGGISITEAVRIARDRWPARTVHVECDTIDQVGEALDAGADALLLDNMDPALVRRCVELARDGGTVGVPLLEVSGGVNLDTVGEYSGTGVDQISVGALTNSAPVLDIGLDL